MLARCRCRRVRLPGSRARPAHGGSSRASRRGCTAGDRGAARRLRQRARLRAVAAACRWCGARGQRRRGAGARRLSRRWAASGRSRRRRWVRSSGRRGFGATSAAGASAPARCVANSAAAVAVGQWRANGHAHARAGRVATSPAIRRRAHEAGVDLTQLAGSGPNGRILREDFEAFVSSRSGPKLVRSRPLSCGRRMSRRPRRSRSSAFAA